MQRGMENTVGPRPLKRSRQTGEEGGLANTEKTDDGNRVGEPSSPKRVRRETAPFLGLPSTQGTSLPGPVTNETQAGNDTAVHVVPGTSNAGPTVQTCSTAVASRANDGTVRSNQVPANESGRPVYHPLRDLTRRLIAEGRMSAQELIRIYQEEIAYVRQLQPQHMFGERPAVGTYPTGVLQHARLVEQHDLRVLQQQQQQQQQQLQQIWQIVKQQQQQPGQLTQVPHAVAPPVRPQQQPGQPPTRLRPLAGPRVQRAVTPDEQMRRMNGSPPDCPRRPRKPIIGRQPSMAPSKTLEQRPLVPLPAPLPPLPITLPLLPITLPLLPTTLPLLPTTLPPLPTTLPPLPITLPPFRDEGPLRPMQAPATLPQVPWSLQPSGGSHQPSRGLGSRLVLPRPRLPDQHPSMPRPRPRPQEQPEQQQASHSLQPIIPASTSQQQQQARPKIKLVNKRSRSTSERMRVSVLTTSDEESSSEEPSNESNVNSVAASAHDDEETEDTTATQSRPPVKLRLSRSISRGNDADK